MTGAKLTVTAGPATGTEIALEPDGELVIGRTAEGLGSLGQDEKLSRTHARIARSGARLTIEDLGSTNGTFVNGEEISGARELRDGDTITVGGSALTVALAAGDRTVLRTRPPLDPGPDATSIRPTPPVELGPLPPVGRAAAPAVSAGGAPGAGGPVGGPPGGGPPGGRGGPPRALIPLLGITAIGLLVALIIVIASKDTTKTKTVAVTSPAAVGWIYVDADTPTPNKNAVVAIPYDKSGLLLSQDATSYPTGGSGAPLVLPFGNSVGTTDGDHQVLLSSDRKLLFAVNQGSNSIAVFHVNAQTGALTPVAGSPFSSFGNAPIGLGYANGTLVVANHGISAPFAPNPQPTQTSAGGASTTVGGSPPGPSYLVSFKVSPSGALTRVSNTAPDPDGLIDATVSPDGNTIVTSGLYPELVKGKPLPTFGPQLIRSVSLSSKGALAQTDAVSFPSSFTAGLAGHVPFFFPPPLYPVAFGIGFNPDPNKKFVYVDATIAGRVAVYDYSNAASLKLVSNTKNPQAGSCWITVSKDGRFLYNSDTGSQTVTVFAISRKGSTLTLKGSVPLKSKGSSDTLAIDPTGHWLYVIGKHDDADAPRPQGIHGDPLDPKTKIVPAPLPANYVDAYKIDQTTGMPTEIATVQIPVPTANMPYGIDILPKG
jgi:hypothetical protein